MTGLTRREADLLAFLPTFLAREGVMPTYAEIAQGLSLRSASHIARMVESLVGKGALRKPARRRVRALSLPGPSICCPNCAHTFAPKSGGAA